MEQPNQLSARIAELETEIERLERENKSLRKKAKQADSANQAKSDFLAMISHEIRTPMNGVIGISELLLDTDLSARQKHFAQLIRTSAASLLALINNLLDFSKIEAEKMALDIEPFVLDDLLSQLIVLYQVTGRRKDLRVTLEIDSSLSGRYLGDAYRLRQVLVNLLGNAVKFTEQGGVELRVVRESFRGRVEQVRFEVRDTGVGIAEESMEKLFHPFSQVDSSSTRRYGGSGLGLSICAKLIKLMGGRFGVDSKLGHGSTFWFILPLEIAQTASEHGGRASEPFQDRPVSPEQDPLDPLPMVSERALRLLIVDDEETNRILMAETFRHTGMEIFMADNGQEAIDLCRVHPFNLVFMDCQMPVKDGFQATAAILAQADKAGRKPPTIIALTADATSTTKKRCKEVGMVDYLVKPLDFRKLQEVLSNWLPELQASILPRSLAEITAVDRENTAPGGSIINREALARLREHVGNITPVAGVFIRSLERRVAELEAAVNRRDAQAVGKVAHTMKGSTSQFGAEELAHLCMLAENMGKSGNLQQIDRIFSQIVQAVAKVKQFFAEQLD